MVQEVKKQKKRKNAYTQKTLANYKHIVDKRDVSFTPFRKVQAKYTFSDCKKDGEKYNEACAPFATLL
jgi:hypothetical protein